MIFIDLVYEKLLYRIIKQFTFVYCIHKAFPINI